MSPNPTAGGPTANCTIDLFLARQAFNFQVTVAGTWAKTANPDRAATNGPANTAGIQEAHSHLGAADQTGSVVSKRLTVNPNPFHMVHIENGAPDAMLVSLSYSVGRPAAYQ